MPCRVVLVRTFRVLCMCVWGEGGGLRTENGLELLIKGADLI